MPWKKPEDKGTIKEQVEELQKRLKALSGEKSLLDDFSYSFQKANDKETVKRLDKEKESLDDTVSRLRTKLADILSKQYEDFMEHAIEPPKEEPLEKTEQIPKEATLKGEAFSKSQKISEIGEAEYQKALKDWKSFVSQSNEDIDKKETDLQKLNHDLIKKLQESITELNNTITDLDDKLDEANKKNAKWSIIALIGGVGLGFVGSVIASLITSPKLPEVIYTNGTVIFP